MCADFLVLIAPPIYGLQALLYKAENLIADLCLNIDSDKNLIISFN